ncbi:MAG TPA: patatin-like phospholipase family protein [Polyangiaceae bacterium]|nr:patatin-like phospholipase family protein [Polyangiaceae bacterium]
MSKMRVALCLPGGGVTGGMYQIGALSALEDSLEGLDARGFDLYVGTSSGATVAAALAGGLPVQRLYRALLDPADDYFPLERAHLTRMDLDEWRRTIVTAFGALRSSVRSLTSRTPSPKDLWEQLDRFYDSLPAGLFTLDAFERFLEEFFLRRGVSNGFPGLPRPLRVVAHDLDSGERVLFGAPGMDDVPVARACCASTALPLFYSPVRIRDRHYIDGGVGRVGHLDVAESEGADLVILVNPMVPVRAEATGVPTGHGARPSVRDKGLMWVYNQGMRIGVHARLHYSLGSAQKASGQPAGVSLRIPLLLIEPQPTDAVLFMHNPASFAARRTILEYAYKTTRDRVAEWIDTNRSVIEQAGFRPVVNQRRA